MTDIRNLTAFVTGGANGIGLGIARSLAKAQVRLALVDLDAEALEKAKYELGELTDIFTAVLDVRDRSSYSLVADSAEQAVGPVSILVNNAGVVGGAPAAKLTYEIWDWGIGINLAGVINGVQTFLPRMISRGGAGHIVNTASGAGLVPPVRTGGTVYTTSKYAVVGLSEALALEMQGNDIGVSVLCPGPVATDIIDRAAASRPPVDEDISPGQRATADQTRHYLANGTPPDAVGDMVVDAICRNRFYIHTDRLAFDRIRAREKALLDAMPPQPEPEATEHPGQSMRGQGNGV